MIGLIGRLAGGAVLGSAGGRSASGGLPAEISIAGSMAPVLHDLDREVARKHVPAALSTSINRTVRTLRARITKEVASTLGLKSSSIRRRIRIKKASRAKPTAWIRFLVRAMSAYTAGAKQTKTGVRVKGRGMIPGAFIQRGGASGLMHVFSRSGSSRYPIDVEHIALWPRAHECAERTIARDGGAIFEKEFAHDLKRRLARIGAPARAKK